MTGLGAEAPIPVFRYQCSSCGLNFSARVASATSSVKCGCGETVERDLPRSFSVSTKVAGDGISAPATGLSGHDYEIDRIVGSDAQTKWDQIAARQKDKVRMIEESGATGFDLSRNPDGSYRVMKPEERAASERSRNFHFKMQDRLEQVVPAEVLYGPRKTPQKQA